MSSITIVELNKQLLTIDSSFSLDNSRKHLSKAKGDADSFASNHLSSAEGEEEGEIADTNNNTQNGSTFQGKRNDQFADTPTQKLQNSCSDLESNNSLRISSQDNDDHGEDSSKPEAAESDTQIFTTSPQVIQAEKDTETASDKQIKEEEENETEAKGESVPVIKQLTSKHPFKRSLAAFLREHGTSSPPLSIPKRAQHTHAEDPADTMAVLEKSPNVRPLFSLSQSSEHLPSTALQAQQQPNQPHPNLLNVPKHALLQLGKHAFPLFSRSQSLNEQDHQQLQLRQEAQAQAQRLQFQQHQQQAQVQAQIEAFRVAMQKISSQPPTTTTTTAAATDHQQQQPQSPLINALKRKETPPMPPTPSSSGYSSAAAMLSPFQHSFNHASSGLLLPPASLLTPPIDSPSIMESQLVKSLLPPPQNASSSSSKPFLFPSLPTPISATTPGGALSSPFLFSAAASAAKSPFDTGPPAFPTSPQFAFPKLSNTGAGVSFQRQFSAPANLQSSLFSTHHHHHQPHDLSPLIFDAQNALNHQMNQVNNGSANAAAATALASHSSELAKSGSRRGRKPIISQSYCPSAPNSEPNSPDIGVIMSDLGLFGGGGGGSGSVISGGSLSERSDSPGAEGKFGGAESHQCGANGWKVTPGSGANCRKRCQNLYHAAKYRDRRRQRMEQLYGEKDALERAQGGHMAKINSLKQQIVNLISQRTVRVSPGGGGSKTYHCPVCGAVFTATDAIRAHLFSVHYHEVVATNTGRQSPGGTAAATATGLSGITLGAPSFAAIATAQNADPSADIAQQICSLTKDWLLRSQVVASLEQLQQSSTLQQQHQQQQQQQQAEQIAKSVSGLTIKSPTPAHFERSLSTGGGPLSALPMVPFN